MRIAIAAVAAALLCGCTASRTPAMDEQGRNWIIQCSETEYSSESKLLRGAECKALLVSEIK